MGMTIDEAMTAGNVQCSRHTVEKWNRSSTMRARITELSEAASNNAIIKSGLDRQYVIGRLMTVVERCMQTEPVRDKKGNPVYVDTPDGAMAPAYTFDSAGATRALELLGKTLRMFDGKAPEDENALSTLTDDDIARIALELGEQTGIIPGRLTHG